MSNVNLIWTAYSAYLRSGGYRAWSSVYRRLWEGAFVGRMPLPLPTLDEVVVSIKRFNYWPDGPRQLNDACSCVGAVEAYLDGEFDRHDGFDCEDLALYVTWQLEHM